MKFITLENLKSFWKDVKSYVDNGLSKKADSVHGTHVTYGTINGKAPGTPSAGTSSKVAREDHVHPVQTTVSGNAGTATKLAAARTINGTSFDGSANITTANWGAARNITIADNDGTNTGSAVSVNGSGNATLKLPATIKASLSGNASTATKATQDSAGQQINKTYIKGLSVSGKTITYTKGDGTTGTIITQDTNTTYSTGTASALGLTKLYTGTGTATDGTMTQAAIKTALDGKANSSHGRHIPDACTTISDWNSATTNGWYMGVNATNAPTSGSNVWYFGEVVAHNTNYVIQTVYQFTVSTDAKAIPKYIRAKTNGTWGAWTNVTVSKAVPANAIFTDTNTWRGVQDNLTSTATDQSLSANQGKVLKGLVDGKANSSHTHNYAGSSSAGGAANSATKLATARTINGTSFDGSANITTTNWGTARTLTIGNSGKSVNGSGNVSWTLSEIGAASTATATTTTNGLMSKTDKSNLNEWKMFKDIGGTIGGATQFEGDIAVIRHDNQTNFEFGKSTFTSKSAYIGLRDRGTGASMGLNFNIRPGVSSSITPTENNGTDLGTWNWVWKDVWVGNFSREQNGYTKLPNGLIIQWGTAEGRIGDFQTVTLPIAFPNKTLICGATVSKNMTAEYDNMHLQATWASCNRWGNVNVQVIFGGNSNTQDILQGDWFAIGY